MRRFLKWLGIAIGVLIALPVLAILVLALFYDWNDARPLLAKAAGTALGREVEINGDLDVDLGWVTRIRMAGLRIANADWGRAEQLLTIGDLDVAIAIKPLLKGDVVIPSLALADVGANLERREDGTGNWSFGGDEPAPAKTDEPARLPLLERLDIRDARVRFDDRRLDKQAELLLDRLEGGEDREARAMFANGSGTYQGRPASLEAKMGSIEVLRQAGQRGAMPYPLDVRLVAGDFRANVAGTIGDPLAFEGLNLDLDIAGDNLSNLFPLTGIPIPPSPPYRLFGRLERSGTKWVFKDFSGLMGSSDMRGTVATDLSGRRPKVEGDVVSKLLDLKDLAGFIGASEGGPQPQTEADDGDGRILPDKEVDLAQLRAVDAKITFKGTRIVTPKVPIDRLDANVSLEDGTFRVQPASFAIGQGKVRVFFSLYGADRPVHSDVEAYIEDIDLTRLLEGSAFVKESAGIFNGRIKLASTGTSVASIAGSADGSVMVVMSGGRFSSLLVELLGLDVAEALGVVIEGDRSIPIRCFVADFAANDGVFDARTLVFDTIDTNTIGSGSINMRDETLNLRLRPYPKDFSPLTLRTALTIQGTLQNPDAFPDPANIGVEGGLKKALNAVLTVVTGLLPPIDTGQGKDAPCADLIRQARQRVGDNRASR